jgi:diaminopimelate epimerase
VSRLYDARGNRYVVATPGEIRDIAPIPPTAATAAWALTNWAPAAIRRFCAFQGREEGRHRSDGLLVGPFPADDAFELLILNTDGTLAERSGNGLTIFARFLVDAALADRDAPFTLRVRHDNARLPPTEAVILPAEREGRRGFWVDMGRPAFGPGAVEASPDSIRSASFGGREAWTVLDLAAISPTWTHSQFVHVGNPHAVTFVARREDLPSMDELRSPALLPRLRAIANSADGGDRPGHGRPSRRGINLQWAAVVDDGVVEARVFERGEGPTPSSGSSATAVASAARYYGLVGREVVEVMMPGGTAPVRFEGLDGASGRAMLFGEAREVAE